ncbi:MAG TPA: hypothetical protein VGN60_13375 [Devosia sp.]|jgi:hypothetical protein|nr:hypothetical protein [Devosia sp.]
MSIRPWHAALLLPLSSLVLLAGCAQNDVPEAVISPATETAMPQLVSAAELIEAADVPTIDPHTLRYPMIEAVIGSGPFCAFHYTREGDPVLGISPGPLDGAPAGVVMLNGDLLALEAAPATLGLVLSAGAIRFTILAEDGESATLAPSPLEEATMLFEVGDQLLVGYGGYYGCAPA